MTNSPQIIMLHSLPDDPKNPNGPTIKEANLAKKHKYALGTLVEVEYKHWFNDDAYIDAQARLYVFGHHRDCDGSPLYILADKTKEHYDHLLKELNLPEEKWYNKGQLCNVYENGFGENGLTQIEVTSDEKEERTII